MTLDQLRAFVTLAETRHFGRAAALLHITQPALTKRIRSLELAWGCPLFDRTGSARLTSLGEMLLPDAAHMVIEANALAMRAGEAARGKFGRLDIGFGLSAMDVAPQIVATYRARHSGVIISLNDFASVEQVDRLLSGRLDVGFVRLPVPDGLDVQPLLEEQLALASPLGWAGSSDQQDSLNTRGFVMLAQHRGPGLAEQISRWCGASGFMPRVTQIADDIQTVLALVAAGVGYGLLPYRSGRLAGGTVRLSPLSGDAARWTVGAAWRQGPQGAVLANFIAAVRQYPTMSAPPAPLKSPQ